MRPETAALLETADKATLTATSGEPSPPCKQATLQLEQSVLTGRGGGEEGGRAGAKATVAAWQRGAVRADIKWLPWHAGRPQHAVVAAGLGGSGTTVQRAEHHGLKQSPCIKPQIP